MDLHNVSKNDLYKSFKSHRNKANNSMMSVNSDNSADELPVAQKSWQQTNKNSMDFGKNKQSQKFASSVKVEEKKHTSYIRKKEAHR